MSACEPLVETCPPGGLGELIGSGLSPGAGWIWFRCAYSACHPGVGHVIIESKTGEILYDGCPTEATRKLIWLDFPAAKLWEGGLMQVNYGQPGCSESGHHCDGATFEWGSYKDTANPLGVAYLDNAGGENDRGNVCDGAVIGVWRSIAQGVVPDSQRLEVSPGWGVIDENVPAGAGNLPDFTVGPYDSDYLVFSGNLEVDDDLVIDGQRVFADDTAGPIVWGSNVFLKFLQAGQTLTLNIWNSGGSTGQNPGGSLYLYPYHIDSSDSEDNLSRCNAFIIPPHTIGAYDFNNPDSLDGTRKVFYRQGGLPDPAPCV